MTEQSVGYAIHVQDPALHHMVEVRFWGTAQRQVGAPGPSTDDMVVRALTGATTQIVAQALANNQVALPTLAHSLAYFSPQIVHASNAELGPYGIQLASVQLQCEVPQSSVAPAAAAIAAAPTPLESAASSLSNNLGNAVARRIPNNLNVKIGGFKVGIGAGGIDGEGLANQANEKAKDTLIHYAIVGGVLLLVCFVCCGAIGFKLLF